MHYERQTVLLASKHEKEKAIAAPFFKHLACTLAIEAFDTDQFGTFTGEIARLASPYESCLLKAKTAAELYGYDLAIASEGSFGPHPSLPFMASAHEIMLFVDRLHNWVIAEQLMTPNTNYAMITIDRSSDLRPFLEQVKFPAHALTLQTNPSQPPLAKGIRQMSDLQTQLNRGFAQHPQLLLATDMRAMMNPTRMEVLAELADKLAIRIATVCPACQTPGFGFKSTEGQLPCSDCGAPTSWYAREAWGCIECDAQTYKSRQDNLAMADPIYCPFCNP